jgi:hypothetical protein
VDPYNLKHLEFVTIDKLSSRFIDFLVLIATDMDAARNVAVYELPDNKVVENFLGLPIGEKGGWQLRHAARALVYT